MFNQLKQKETQNNSMFNKLTQKRNTFFNKLTPFGSIQAVKTKYRSLHNSKDFITITLKLLFYGHMDHKECLK